jgi:hypothetical protein
MRSILPRYGEWLRETSLPRIETRNASALAPFLDFRKKRDGARGLFSAA